MSTAHPLRDIERINGPPGPYLASIGTVFATFGAALGEVVRRACRPERAARYRSMEEFYAAWQQARRI